MKSFRFNTKIIVGFFVISFFLIALPMTVITALQRQQYTQQAAAPQVCGNAPGDYILIIDRSGSMKGTKLTDAEAAAKNFVDILSKDTRNRVGLVTFAATANLDTPITTNYSSVKTAIDSMKTADGTNMQAAVVVANNAFAADQGTPNKRIAILLTDGQANMIDGSTKYVSTSIAESATISEVKNGFASNNTPYYTIGLGSGVHAAFLTQIASLTSATYSFAPTSPDLTAIYGQISTISGKGSISGVVYNDSNGNHVLDTGELGLSLWAITVKNGAGQIVSQSLSDTTGNYTFTGLCDGSYTISEQLQSGWKQSEPTVSDTYVVTITNGSAVADKNFGNTSPPGVTITSVPTDTPVNTPTDTPTGVPVGQQISTSPVPVTLVVTPSVVPGDSSVKAKVFLHGRLNGGDSLNPHGGNPNPLHPQVALDVTVIGVNNAIVASGSGIITADGASGNYQGTIDIGKVSSGVYNVRLHVSHYLTSLIPGVALTSAAAYNLPAVSLIAGDMNNDNQVDVQDYNLFINCYAGDPALQADNIAAPNCPVSQKTAADINDDGKVDLIDYNTFDRELSIRRGQ